MDGVQQLDEIIPLIEKVVEQIRPDQLDNPTACAQFTVAGVLEHMIGGATHFSPAFRGGEAGSAPALEGPITDRWNRAMAELLDSLHSPGAQERTVTAPFGEVPVSDFARYTAFDGLIHGWDLSRATGLPYDPPDDLVGQVGAFARELRAAGDARRRHLRAPRSTPPPTPARSTPSRRSAAVTLSPQQQQQLRRDSDEHDAHHPTGPGGRQGQAAGHLVQRQLRRDRHDPADRRRVALPRPST